ncbi:MAG: hypothetical protein Q4A28_06940 [Brachymonas sp.]|nr:hypothetical protein [Brachymonas sp.]
MEKITVEQAYRAMFYFLENEYELTHSEELAGMLGSLSWEIFDGGPADSASWSDWLNAVKKAINKPDMPVGI